MTNEEKRKLIRSYQEDYTKNTGEYIKITDCNKWESIANISVNIPFWTLVKLIFDYTDWSKKSVFTIGSGRRQVEKVFARSLICFMAINNGNSYVDCAKATHNHHTSIIHAVTEFENRLELELHVRKFFEEVCKYVRENYYIYENQEIKEEDV